MIEAARGGQLGHDASGSEGFIDIPGRCVREDLGEPGSDRAYLRELVLDRVALYREEGTRLARPSRRERLDAKIPGGGHQFAHGAVPPCGEGPRTASRCRESAERLGDLRVAGGDEGVHLAADHAEAGQAGALTLPLRALVGSPGAQVGMPELVQQPVEGRDAHPASAAGKLRLGSLLTEFGREMGVSTPDNAVLAKWFTGKWGNGSPGTWNVRRVGLRAACRYWADQRWVTDDLAGRLRARKVAPDRSRTLSRADVEALLTREDITIRERTLWCLLYESAAGSAEVLRLDVEELDLANRKAKVWRKGGAVDVIVWQTGTACLRPRLLKGRRSGPLFLTNRRARVELPPADIDPDSGKARLSYRQAEDLFKAASGGETLHQLRHSALTHDAEDGTSTVMLMAKSGHTSIASLARYARPSAEALQRHQQRTDPRGGDHDSRSRMRQLRRPRPPVFRLQNGSTGSGS